MNKPIRMLAALFGLALAAPLAIALDPMPPEDTPEGAFPKQDHYSPYAGRNFSPWR